MIVFKRVSSNDFNTVIQIIKSSFGNTKLYKEVPSIDLKSSPYTWFGDSALDWVIVLKNNNPCAFLLSRLVKNNYHLHSINIAEKYQMVGLGTEIIKYHWEKGFHRNPQLDSYTLHVNHQNKDAIRFYKKLGYRRFYFNQLIQPNSGIDNWIRNCQEKNDWPLRKGHLLYFKQG